MSTPARKPLLGINLVLDNVIQNGAVELITVPRSRSLKFDCFAGYKIPGALFVTTPVLRKRLEQLLDIRSRPIKTGSVKVYVDFSRREVSTYAFFPFSAEETAFQWALENQGTGTIIERRVEKFLFRHFPDFHITTSGTVSPSRTKQIESRGRKLGEPIPLREALRLSKQHIIRNFQKNRRPRPARRIK